MCLFVVCLCVCVCVCCGVCVGVVCVVCVCGMCGMCVLVVCVCGVCCMRACVWGEDSTLNVMYMGNHTIYNGKDPLRHLSSFRLTP